VSDQLWTGRRFRALCVVDDCTKESLAIYADVSISGLRLSYLLEALSALRGYPREIVLDNVLRTEASLFADDEHPERDVE
jgi:putative transposase